MSIHNEAPNTAKASSQRAIQWPASVTLTNSGSARNTAMLATMKMFSRMGPRGFAPSVDHSAAVAAAQEGAQP